MRSDRSGRDRCGAIVCSSGGDEWMIVHGSGDTMALLQASADGREVQVEFTDDLHDLSGQGPTSLEIPNANADIDLADQANFEHAPAALYLITPAVSREQDAPANAATRFSRMAP